MFDLFSNATDDQIALLGCLAAFLFSALLTVLSTYVGQLSQNRRTKVHNLGPRRPKLGSRRLGPSSEESSASSPKSQDKAA